MFSVVIPVHNKLHTLRRTVESALQQGFADFELIVVDDGSSDRSLEALEGLADSRIRLIEQDNRGPGPARNAGAAAARAEWIAFLDADDWWFGDHLSELDRIRRAHPAAGLIGTAYGYSRLGSPPMRKEARSRIAAIDYFGAIGRGERALFTSSAAISKQVWLEEGGFADFPSGQDSELWVRIALRHQVAVSSRVTTLYVRGTGGITESQKTRWLRKPLDSISDLSPAVATLVSRRAKAPRELQPSLDAYIRRYMIWCLRDSARIGDLDTVRALARLYPEPGDLRDRLLLLLARLPEPVARHACKLAALA
jgi:glycosyltransferase involved in cell wall biosynthesis